MRSVVELRAEARRLRETIENVADPALKQELAARALDLSIRAAEIARSHEAPEILRMNISRYRSMLAGAPMMTRESALSRRCCEMRRRCSPK